MYCEIIVTSYALFYFKYYELTDKFYEFLAQLNNLLMSKVKGLEQ